MVSGAPLNESMQRVRGHAVRSRWPSELPVQAPVKFELVINLKTAKAVGLDVPVQLQQRADKVIE